MNLQLVAPTVRTLSARSTNWLGRLLLWVLVETSQLIVCIVDGTAIVAISAESSLMYASSSAFLLPVQEGRVWTGVGGKTKEVVGRIDYTEDAPAYANGNGVAAVELGASRMEEEDPEYDEDFDEEEFKGGAKVRKQLL